MKIRGFGMRLQKAGAAAQANARAALNAELARWMAHWLRELLPAEAYARACRDAEYYRRVQVENRIELRVTAGGRKPRTELWRDDYPVARFVYDALTETMDEAASFEDLRPTGMFDNWALQRRERREQGRVVASVTAEEIQQAATEGLRGVAGPEWCEPWGKWPDPRDSIKVK